MSLGIRSFRWPRRWLLWLAAGLVLRLVFVCFPRPVDDDTWDYLQMGHNLCHYGIYGTGTGGIDGRGGEDAGGDSAPDTAHAMTGKHVQSVIEFKLALNQDE